MQGIFWAETPKLEAISHKESLVKELFETLNRTILTAFIPMYAYAKKFEQFLDLVKLDIKEHVK